MVFYFLDSLCAIIESITMRIKQISAGYFHVLAISYEGLTFGWGKNDYGQIGLGRKEVIVNKPTKIKAL